jgi:hypothetical protein
MNPSVLESLICCSCTDSVNHYYDYYLVFQKTITPETKMQTSHPRAFGCCLLDCLFDSFVGSYFLVLIGLQCAESLLKKKENLCALSLSLCIFIFNCSRLYYSYTSSEVPNRFGFVLVEEVHPLAAVRCCFGFSHCYRSEQL